MDDYLDKTSYLGHYCVQNSRNLGFQAIRFQLSVESSGVLCRKMKRLGKAARQVIDMIEVNPKATSESIALGLGISRSAARKRLQRLINSDAVCPTLIVAPKYSRLIARSFVTMTISTKVLNKKNTPGYPEIQQFAKFLTTELNKTPEFAEFFSSRSDMVVIRGAYSVAGMGLGLDMVVHLEATNDATLRSFVTEVLGRLTGVVETNTGAIIYSGN